MVAVRRFKYNKIMSSANRSLSEAELLASRRMQYWQGWQAFQNRVPHTKNPYTPQDESEYWKLWNSGWQDAAIAATPS